MNIGVRKATFSALFGTNRVAGTSYDFTALDTLMPHPEYAAQSWVCVLNPSAATFQRAVQPLLAEAYDMAVQRRRRRHNASES